MIWIIDASVALRWYLKEERHPNADEVLMKLIGEPERFAVPELFAYEVYSVQDPVKVARMSIMREIEESLGRKN